MLGIKSRLTAACLACANLVSVHQFSVCRDTIMYSRRVDDSIFLSYGRHFTCSYLSGNNYPIPRVLVQLDGSFYDQVIV